MNVTGPLPYVLANPMNPLALVKRYRYDNVQYEVSEVSISTLPRRETLLAGYLGMYRRVRNKEENMIGVSLVFDTK